jgi:small subunit ribosomal protein S20
VAAPTRKKHLSVRKRQRQSAKRHLRNQATKSRVKTFIKKVQEALAKRDETAAATQLQIVTRVLYKAAGKDVLHRNTAARRVSRLAKRVHELKITPVSSGSAQA